MIRKCLYATTNPGKIAEIRQIFRRNELALCSPSELGLRLDVPEPGATLEENATDKVRAYRAALDGAAQNYLVLADDTGLEIDALNGAPGIHVRRWAGYRMSDQAIIDYCLQQMQNIPTGARGAQFRTVVALGVPSDEIEHYAGTLRGVILEEADPLRIEGFPIESIFYALPDAEKTQLLTHREQALEHALPRIRELIGRGMMLPSRLIQ